MTHAEHDHLPFATIQTLAQRAVTSAVRDDDLDVLTALEPLSRPNTCPWDAFRWIVMVTAAAIYDVPHELIAAGIAKLDAQGNIEAIIPADQAPADVPTEVVMYMKLAEAVSAEDTDAAIQVWSDVLDIDYAGEITSGLMGVALGSAVRRVRQMNAGPQ